jgi:HD superfamily phosphohydrolase
MTREYTRAIRDPVHQWINLTDAETQLVDSPFLQRLRWISQLSGVRMVFPGAMHSRLAHVLGVAHLAGEYAEQIYKGDSDKDHQVQLARLGGLLHDVAHGPFSHAYDDTVYRDLYPGNRHGHDTHRFKLINSDLLKTKIEDCGIDLKDLEGLWKGDDPVIQAITQGALGADRTDPK